jgi:hypothetical protein
VTETSLHAGSAYNSVIVRPPERSAFWLSRWAVCRNNTAAIACRRRFRNLDHHTQEDLTQRYEELCTHYGMTPSRNNRCLAHEKGAIESPHGHLKKVLADELLSRGARDFEDLAAYRCFIDESSVGAMRATASASRSSAPALRPLPERRTTDYEEARACSLRRAVASSCSASSTAFPPA